LEIGVPASEAESTFAIVGDSHAGALLEMLDVVARAKRWRGLAVTLCPATVTPSPSFDETLAKTCANWNEQLLKWLPRHPEIRTLFTTAESDPAPGAADSFLREWRAMPRGLDRIVVIRDNPFNLKIDCVERSVELTHAPLSSCDNPRDKALPPDPAVEAASRFPKAQVIDLTDLYCGSAVCPGVIGGVSVYYDDNHLTPLYARTLAPFFLRRLDALEPRRAAAGRAR
jgi:hypothetical protein